jgi:isopenicillin-N epimerase
MSLNRRQFLAGSGLVAAAAVLTGTPLRSSDAAGPADTSSDSTGGAGKERGATATDWDGIRAQFDLSPEWVHLAGLLLSSHPTPVRAAIERHRRALDDNPPHYLFGNGSRLEGNVRRAAAAYMGVRPEEVALTDSTTQGLGILYNGIDVRPGQELLTTTHDHRVTHESLAFRAERSGLRLRRAPLYERPQRATAEEIVGNLERAIRPETRVIAVTWVHSSTGVKLPVHALAEVVARHNRGRADADRALLCVDGVHGFGVEDIDLAAMGCDFFAAGTHKWLFGPRGTGVLWGHPRSQRLVGPTIPTFSRDGTWGGTMSPGGFHSFEHRWALADAFAFHEEIGKARVAERIHALNSQLKEGLAGMRHVTLYTPRSPDLSSGITCFDVQGLSPSQVVARLRDRRIIASTTPYSPSYARFTPGLLNTPEEVDRALAAVREMG